jgi:hypothetical protein
LGFFAQKIEIFLKKLARANFFGKFKKKAVLRLLFSRFLSIFGLFCPKINKFWPKKLALPIFCPKFKKKQSCDCFFIIF